MYLQKHYRNIHRIKSNIFKSWAYLFFWCKAHWQLPPGEGKPENATTFILWRRDEICRECENSISTVKEIAFPNSHVPRVLRSSSPLLSRVSDPRPRQPFDFSISITFACQLRSVECAKLIFRQRTQAHWNQYNYRLWYYQICVHTPRHWSRKAEMLIRNFNVFLFRCRV